MDVVLIEISIYFMKSLAIVAVHVFSVAYENTVW